MPMLNLTKKISILGRFSISIPDQATHRLIENESSLEVIVSEGYAPLYIKRYPLVDRMGLRSEAERFYREGVCSVVGSSPAYDIEKGRCGQLNYEQLVVLLDPSKIWLARLVAKPSAKFYYLIHIVDEPEHTKYALGVVTTFSILEK